VCARGPGSGGAIGAACGGGGGGGGNVGTTWGSFSRRFLGGSCSGGELVEIPQGALGEGYGLLCCQCLSEDYTLSRGKWGGGVLSFK